MSNLKADYVTDVTVIDPDTNKGVDISIYKDRETGAMLGIDREYIITLSEEDPVSSPFNGKDLELVEEPYAE